MGYAHVPMHRIVAMAMSMSTHEPMYHAVTPDAHTHAWSHAHASMLMFLRSKTCMLIMRRHPCMHAYHAHTRPQPNARAPQLELGQPPHERLELGAAVDWQQRPVALVVVAVVIQAAAAWLFHHHGRQEREHQVEVVDCERIRDEVEATQCPHTGRVAQRQQRPCAPAPRLVRGRSDAIQQHLSRVGRAGQVGGPGAADAEVPRGAEGGEGASARTASS
eukprot:352048-Chlamydomonas_euryale.AAC.9